MYTEIVYEWNEHYISSYMILNGTNFSGHQAVWQISALAILQKDRQGTPCNWTAEISQKHHNYTVYGLISI